MSVKLYYSYRYWHFPDYLVLRLLFIHKQQLKCTRQVLHQISQLQSTFIKFFDFFFHFLLLGTSLHSCRLTCCTNPLQFVSNAQYLGALFTWMKLFWCFLDIHHSHAQSIISKILLKLFWFQSKSSLS